MTKQLSEREMTESATTATRPPLAAGEYVLDPSHTHVGFLARHLASVLDDDDAARLRDALSSIADGLGGDGAFLGCTGGDAEDRLDPAGGLSG